MGKKKLFSFECFYWQCRDELHSQLLYDFWMLLVCYYSVSLMRPALITLFFDCESELQSEVTPLVGVVYSLVLITQNSSPSPFHLPLRISSTEDERVLDLFRYLNAARFTLTVARLVTVPLWPRAEQSAGGRWSVCFVSMGVDVMPPPLRNLKCFSPVMCQCKLICSNRTLSLMFGCKVSRVRARSRFCWFSCG